MTDVPASMPGNLLISKLVAARVDRKKLASAAETARRLCTQVGSIDGACLEPRSHLDFQHLLEALAGKSSA